MIERHGLPVAIISPSIRVDRSTDLVQVQPPLSGISRITSSKVPSRRSLHHPAECQPRSVFRMALIWISFMIILKGYDVGKDPVIARRPRMP